MDPFLQSLYGPDAGMIDPAVAQALVQNPALAAKVLDAQGVPPPQGPLPSRPGQPGPWNSVPPGVGGYSSALPQPGMPTGPADPRGGGMVPTILGGPPPPVSTAMNTPLPATASAPGALPAGSPLAMLSGQQFLQPPVPPVAPAPMPGAASGAARRPGAPLNILPPAAQGGPAPDAAATGKPSGLASALSGVKAPSAPAAQKVSSPAAPATKGVAGSDIDKILMQLMGPRQAQQLMTLAQALRGVGG